MNNSLTKIFPEESSIPEQYKIPSYLEQREYLINGELLLWKGDLSPVMSPVFIKNGDALKQSVIGSTPLLTADEALKALDSAVKAHDLGKGVWPMMSVVDRIAC